MSTNLTLCATSFITQPTPVMATSLLTQDNNLTPSDTDSNDRSLSCNVPVDKPDDWSLPLLPSSQAQIVN